MSQCLNSISYAQLLQTSVTYRPSRWRPLQLHGEHVEEERLWAPNFVTRLSNALQGVLPQQLTATPSRPCRATAMTRHPVSATLILALSLTALRQGAVADQARDARILLEWKQGFTCPDVPPNCGLACAGTSCATKVVANWVGERPCQDGWWGIRCDESEEVVAIDIDLPSLYDGKTRYALTADLPTGLAALNLTELRLVGVTLANPTLPPWPTLSKLKHLRSLSLLSTGLEGPLPSAAELPPSLEALHLSELNGTSFPDWSSLANLVELSLQGSFQGKLPPARLLPPNLETLDVSHCLMDRSKGYCAPTEGGSIPHRWATLPLKRLSAVALGLRGSLPRSLPNTLESLDISKNTFQGGLPPAWRVATALKELACSGCNLAGELPEAVQMPPALQVLRLDGNKLSGALPSSWPGSLKLQVLHLSENSLSGSLPPLDGLAPTLETLDISYNAISGPLPPTNWTLFSHLRDLLLFSNQLSGQLPADLAPSLEVFHAKSNNFSGSLPAGWAQQAKQLYSLDLAYNRDVVGEIPAAWDSPDAFPAASGPDRLWTTGLLLAPTSLCGPVPAALQGKVAAEYRSGLKTLGRCPSSCQPHDNAPPCSSTFFTLPSAPSLDPQDKFNLENESMLPPEDALLLFPAKLDRAQQVASNFCQARGFEAAGTIVPARLPAVFQLQEKKWRSFDWDSWETCVGKECLAFGIIECVEAGAKPLQPDSQNNIGCGNTGTDNIGSWNVGSGNIGNCNQGSNNVGDGNGSAEQPASNDVGNDNAQSSFWGDKDEPWE